MRRFSSNSPLAWLRELNLRRRRRRKARNTALVRKVFRCPVPLEGPLPPLSPLNTRQPSPELSLILAYTSVDASLRCLASLQIAPPASTFEILLWSAADEIACAARGLRDAADLRLVSIPRDCIGHGWNIAASQARGCMLMLLHDHSQLCAGAVDVLNETLKRDATIGLVGAKLLDPNGRMLEIGGRIMDDGRLVSAQVSSDPLCPEHNYLCDREYVAWNGLMVRTELWAAIGGAACSLNPLSNGDALFADLALRVAQAGARVVFQPLAQVIDAHVPLAHGGGTDALNQNADIRQRLSDFARNKGPADLSPRRVLVIDRSIPRPDHDAGSKSTLDIILALMRRKWAITFWPDDLVYDETHTVALQQLGVEVLYQTKQLEFSSWLEINAHRLSLVLINRPDMARNYLWCVRHTSAVPVAYYGHDLHHSRLYRQATLTGDEALKRKAQAMLRLEQDIWSDVDVSLYPTELEARAVQALSPGVNVRSIPGYCFDRFELRDRAPDRSRVLFVAGFRHEPNVDAAHWLVLTIWPMIQARVGNSSLHIVGSHPTPQILALSSDQVEVLGHVSAPTLERLYACARVVVVPLRFGAGLKLKSVEALQQGIPLVTTPVGAEGINGLELVATVTEEAEQFATAVVKLLCDDRAWLHQSTSQSDLARKLFSRAGFDQSIHECLLSIGLA